MRHFGVTFAEKTIIKAMDSDSMQSPHFQAPGASRLMDLGKTPIKTARLEHYLQFYPSRMDAHILLEGFTNGFKINYRGPRQSFDCSNLISARQHEAELGEKIEKEIQAVRIAGPFKQKPFSNLRLSPIGLVVEKPSPGSEKHGCRMIQHLSYTAGNSVSNFIDP